MNYTHKVFYSEVRGTGVYTRVQIDIEGESEPLVIGFDIAGSVNTQEAIDAVVQSRVADFVLERSQAVSTCNTLIGAQVDGDISDAASAVQEQLNTALEPLGLSVVVSVIE